MERHCSLKLKIDMKSKREKEDVPGEREREKYKELTFPAFFFFLSRWEIRNKNSNNTKINK